MQHQWTDKNKYYTFFGCDQTKLPPGVVSFLGHLNLAKQHWLQTGFQCKQQSASTNTKLLTKHVSNTWMQTSWFWWLIKLKRILLFSDLSWSNWKESSVSILVNPFTLLVNHVSNTYFWSILVNPSHFWSIPHTSGQSLLVDPSHVTSAISGQSFTLLINLSHFCQWRLVNP